MLGPYPTTGLEVAADYLNAGLWQDGSSLLTQVVEAARATVQSLAAGLLLSGLLCGQKLNHPEKASTWFQCAPKAPTDYVFPFQMEMIPVLEAAMQANPADSRAPYYLGNLLYDWQPERAVALGKIGRAQRRFPRCLPQSGNGLRQAGRGPRQGAGKPRKGRQVWRQCHGLQRTRQALRRERPGAAKRLALLESHQPVINRDEVIAREVNLEIFAGKADAALELLQDAIFPRLGRRRPILARRFLGERQSGPRPSAVRRQAVQGGPRGLPGRQRVARDPARGRRQSRRPQGRGRLLDRKRLPGPGRKGECPAVVAGSRRNLRHAGKRTGPFWRRRRGRPRAKSCRGRRGRRRHVAQAASYYQALALEKLGEGGRAKAIFERLAETGAKALNDAPKLDGKSYATAAERGKVADAHYLAGLGQLGLKNKDKARQEFSAALACQSRSLRR